MDVEALAKPLDAARVRQRQGRGGGPALSYLETHDVIRTANAIFGFGNWGHEIVELRQLPFTSVKKDTKDGVHIGYVCIVRLAVRDCVPVSGVGYGDAVEYTQSAAVTAHELAAKEAESDALKRALKNYGDQFGLALYDKQAASSGHVVTAAVSSQDDVLAKTTAFKKYTTACETWAELDPEFDLKKHIASGLRNDANWLQRNTKTVEAKIAEKIAAQNSEKAAA